MQRVLAPALTAVCLTFTLACQSLAPPDEASGEIAARVGDREIRVDELDAMVRDDLYARETDGGHEAKVYDLRTRALRNWIARNAVEYEAEQRGVSVDELLRSEAEALGDVSDEEIERFYQEHASELRGSSLDELAPRIRTHLREQRQRAAVDAIIAAADAETRLGRPRVEVREGGPSRGPDDARVTIIEYSDFQCPFCRRAGPVLEELEKRYPNDVRVVYRHLPLDSLHPRARAGAEASACAAEGGLFWEYHDLLFENGRALEDADLRRYAEEVGLDAEAFEACFTSRRYAAAVEADAREAAEIGISGTPAFVVNGILLFGLQPVEAFDEIIRAELGHDAGGSL